MPLPIGPTWGLARITAEIAAVAMVALFVVGCRRVGRALAQAFGVEERGGGLHLLLGLAAYVLVAIALGAAGWLRWPVLAALALLPGAAALVAALGRWLRSRPRRLPRLCAVRPALAAVCVAAALPFLLDALTPPTHYDLLANYLTVAKEDLLQGGIRPLAHNVHSSQSIALDLLLAYLLSLAELVRRGPFMFGDAMTVPAFDLVALALIVRSLAGLTRRLVPKGLDPRTATLWAALLFLGFPQTQLLASLHSCDLITTAMALMLMAEVIGREHWDGRTGFALGVAGGLLLAAKLQLAMVVAVAGAVLLLRARRLAPAAAFAGGALAILAPVLLRNAAAYGSALFPYVTGGSPQDAAGRALLAENGYLGGVTWPAFVANVVRLFTQQPEIGISFAVLPLVLLPRRGRLEVALFAAVPLLSMAALTGATYHALRWAQPSVALLFVMVAANWASLVENRRLGAVVAGCFVAMAFLVGLARAWAINPTLDVLNTDEATFITERLPSYPVRARLVAQARRVLYLKELMGFYGVENGVVPSVFDDAYLARFFDAGTPAEIAARLAAAGFSHVAVGRAYDGELGQGLTWRWLDPRHRAAVAAFFGSLPVVSRDHAVTVYALGKALP